MVHRMTGRSPTAEFCAGSNKTAVLIGSTRRSTEASSGSGVAATAFTSSGTSSQTLFRPEVCWDGILRDHRTPQLSGQRCVCGSISKHARQGRFLGRRCRDPAGDGQETSLPKAQAGAVITPTGAPVGLRSTGG